MYNFSWPNLDEQTAATPPTRFSFKTPTREEEEEEEERKKEYNIK
jgi:hypothetical protein